MRSVLIRFVVVLGALMLLGCVAAGEAPTVSDAARAASQGVATAAPATPVALPPSVAPALSTEPAPTQEEPTPPATPFDDATWLTYANARYGFTLRYPADWALQEVTEPPHTMAGHLVQVSSDAGAQPCLSIGFKRADEAQWITRTGVGSGDLVPMGVVAFLGEDVDRVVLVLEERHMGVLYNGASEIARHDLVFTISLDVRGDVARGPGLTPADEEVADRIVVSVARIE